MEGLIFTLDPNYNFVKFFGKKLGCNQLTAQLSRPSDKLLGILRLSSQQICNAYIYF